MLFAGFAKPMQAEFPRFGGLRSDICRLAPCIYLSRCIISLLPRTTDGNQVAPLTREHPRRRYTPVDLTVDYPWADGGVLSRGGVSAGQLDYQCYYALLARLCTTMQGAHRQISEVRYRNVVRRLPNCGNSAN
jgi:hypothetical protein